MAKTKNMVAVDSDWQTEDDVRTLANAAEIRKDSKRLAAAQKLAQKKLLALAAVAGDPDDADGDD